MRFDYIIAMILTGVVIGLWIKCIYDVIKALRTK